MTQRTLFDDLPGGAKRRRRRQSISERFEAFDAAHPDVYQLFHKFAGDLRARGRKRYSADAILHRIRWHMATSSAATADEFKINNDYSAYYARKLAAEHEEFRDFFETRKLKAK